MDLSGSAQSGMLPSMTTYTFEQFDDDVSKGSTDLSVNPGWVHLVHYSKNYAVSLQQFNLILNFYGSFTSSGDSHTLTQTQTLSNQELVDISQVQLMEQDEVFLHLQSSHMMEC